MTLFLNQSDVEFVEIYRSVVRKCWEIAGQEKEEHMEVIKNQLEAAGELPSG